MNEKAETTLETRETKEAQLTITCNSTSRKMEAQRKGITSQKGEITKIYPEEVENWIKPYKYWKAFKDHY